MIELLTAVTVVYAVILVVVVAASLIVIGLALRSIGGNLGRIADGLKIVERQTAPLTGYVTALNDGLGQVADGLATTAHHLDEADAELAAAMGEPRGDEAREVA